jgi:cell division protein FtsA
MSVHSGKMVAAIDIGTTKVVALVGAVASDGSLSIVGFGTHPSLGLKRGVVVDIESTTHAICQAVEQAERMAGRSIQTVCAGIAGSHIRSFNAHGIVAIRNKEVTQHDVDRVIDAAKAIAMPSDQKILHVVPQYYLIDEQDGIREPIGMSGIRLEAKVHIVSGAVSSAQNILNCVRRCGLEVKDIILEQLASSYAVLSEDEKNLGVCMIDIGGGTTDIAVYVDGAIRHSSVIPIAGHQVTNDIAVSMRTPTTDAETLKINEGTVLLSDVSDKSMVEVPGVGAQSPKQLSKRVLAEVIEARYQELFELIHQTLKRNGVERYVVSGYVLTGGGANVEGAAALAARVFDAPVRVATPKQLEGMDAQMLSPIYATAVGLLLFGHEKEQRQEEDGSGRLFEEGGLFSRMRQWFQCYF